MAAAVGMFGARRDDHASVNETSTVRALDFHLG